MAEAEIDLAGFAAAYRDGAPVIDVREPDEYTQAHVPGASLVPMGQLGARLPTLPADGPLYVICAVGVRSLVAAQALRQAGLDAWSVAGGTQAWLGAGGAVVTGSEPGEPPAQP